MGPFTEREGNLHFLPERQFQAESSMIHGKALHYPDGHGPLSIQGKTAQV